jgi:two-component system phosphate regulon sensor histidine kinase PhoR
VDFHEKLPEGSAMNSSLGLDQVKVYTIIKNNLPVGFSIVDREGLIVDFNAAAERITGYSSDEVMGKSHYQILHGTADNAGCPLLHLSLRHHENTVETESSIIRKNGGRAILSVTSFPLIDDAGTFLGGVELFRDVTAIKKLERERKNILQMFAHDMKNPVLTSGGLISRLLAGKAGELSPRQGEYLSIMQDNLQRVERLVMDFLDFSKYESKEYKPAFEYFDLKEKIRRVIDSVRVEADNKNIEISYIPPENGPVMIHADPMMLDRVMNNLLGNALKYTDADGKVRVELCRRKKNVVVHVADTGIGIPEKHLPHIFDAFFRGSRDSSGSGLGLAIARTIIEAHGGRIWVSSSPHTGTSFSFVLPTRDAID